MLILFGDKPAAHDGVAAAAAQTLQGLVKQIAGVDIRVLGADRAPL